MRLAFVVATLLASAGSASAQPVSRYSGTLEGGVAVTGNALGLSKADGSNGPGTDGSIGTFMANAASTDLVPTALATPWGAGTTSDWRQNASAGAPLVLPAGSSVVYAELVWGGSYQYGSENVSAFLDTSVTLSFGGVSTLVAPDPATSVTLSQLAGAGFPVRDYIRSADVTAFVTSNGAGVYTTGGVPGTQQEIINTLNGAGWSLLVVYADPAEATRSISLLVGGAFVEDVSLADADVSGFCTPPSGGVTATIFASAITGDANLTGDSLLLAPTAADTFVPLSGVNNPEANFFASQIDGPDGAIATGGTHGFDNHDAAGATNVIGGRQGWDLAVVPVTSAAGQLANAQTTAVIRAQTTGDTFVPALFGFAVDVDAPDIVHTNAVSITPAAPRVGDVLSGTLLLTNAGTAVASNITLALDLPAGFDVTAFAIDGTPEAVDSAALAAGVAIGTMDTSASLTITFTLDSSSATPGFVTLAPSVSYGFESCPSTAALSGTVNLETTSFELLPPTSGDDDDDGGGGGCGCHVLPSSRSAAPFGALLLALGLVAFRRR